MRRFLLDTGIAQDFINRRHGVVERSDAERVPGTASASVPRSWASSGLGSREASRATQSPAIAAVPVAAGRLAVHQRRGRAVRSGDRRTAANGAADAADRHHGGGRRVFTRQLHGRLPRHRPGGGSRVDRRELGCGRLSVIIGIAGTRTGPGASLAPHPRSQDRRAERPPGRRLRRRDRNPPGPAVTGRDPTGTPPPAGGRSRSGNPANPDERSGRAGRRVRNRWINPAARIPFGQARRGRRPGPSSDGSEGLATRG